MVKKLIILILILVLAFTLGCDEDSTEEPIEEPITNFEECLEAGNPAMESYPRQCRSGNQTFVEEIEPENVTEDEPENNSVPVEAQENISEPATTEEPFCGDNTCDDNENCEDCWEDCRCGPQEECSRGECKYIECGLDRECSDDDACTTDVCMFPTHPNSFCEHKPIDKCKNRDGCCPEECTANDDSDCEPVCGNDACEDGENSTICEDDCSVCGNQICESGEDHMSCPDDCYQ